MTTTLAQREAEYRRKAADLAAERVKNDEARDNAVAEAAAAAAHKAYDHATGPLRDSVAEAYAELEAAEQSMDLSVIIPAFITYHRARLAQNTAERTATALLDQYDPQIGQTELWTYHTDSDGNQLYDDNGQPFRTMNTQAVGLKANGQRPRPMPAEALPADFSEYVSAVVQARQWAAVAVADAEVRAIVNTAKADASKPYEK